MSQRSRMLVAAVTLVAMLAGASGTVYAGSAKLKQVATITNPAGPMDEFDIVSTPGKGTTIVMTKWER